jgi:hypothetical protein
VELIHNWIDPFVMVGVFNGGPVVDKRNVSSKKVLAGAKLVCVVGDWRV